MSPIDLSPLIAFLASSKYILLAIGSYVEGSGVMITGGFLLRQGALSFWPLMAALWAGDFLSDLTLYFIGYYGARPVVLRFGRLLNVTPQVLDKVEHRFHRYHTWILIISKLTMGFGFAYATLLTAGMLRVSIVRYVLINGLGGFIWIPFLIFMGYEFGSFIESIHITLGFKIGFAIAALVGFLSLARYASGRLAVLD